MKSIMYLSGALLVLLFGALFLSTSVSSQLRYANSPTATEVRGGLMGSLLGELRCPVNLAGQGPTWKTITIGQSSVQDLEALYAPYGSIVVTGTPFPPVLPYPEGEYALNYKIQVDRSKFQPQLGLPSYVEACVVNNKIAALTVYTWDDSNAPHFIEQLISLLGRPAVLSWHEDDQDTRLLHWPTEGISAEISYYKAVYYIYYYPFRRANYRELWPINALLNTPPILYPNPDPTLEIFDFPAIELTLTANPAWPTRTPHPQMPTTDDPRPTSPK